MKKENDFILQREGSCCTLIALCNARRYFGMGSPSPGSWSWNYLIDVACCRHGGVPADRIHVLTKRLGLRLKSIEFDEMHEHLPALLVTRNPVDFGSTLHTSLVTDMKDDVLVMVNYRWKMGPVIDEIDPSDIVMPNNKKFRGLCFAVSPRNAAGRTISRMRRITKM